MKCKVCGEELVLGKLDDHDYGPGKPIYFHQGSDPWTNPQDPNDFHWPKPSQPSVWQKALAALRERYFLLVELAGRHIAAGNMKTTEGKAVILKAAAAVLDASAHKGEIYLTFPASGSS